MKRRLVIGVLVFWPVLLTGLLWLAGQGQPCLVYDSTTQLVRGGFGQRAWLTMRQRGKIVRYDGFGDWFFGGLKGSHGDIVVAAGIDGVAFARANCPGSRYGGKVRGWMFLTHANMIAVAMLGSLFMFLLVRLTQRVTAALGIHWFVPLGHCRVCHYDLTGNESGVCPECGEATQCLNEKAPKP